ncbi:MAG: GGDEF domain-containing protein [Methylotenera sp.]|nr:MAG: GGDEF domain-containing protein [Methylotenera sp.]
MKKINPHILESDQHLRTLIDNFPFMVWLKDVDSRILAANAAYANMVGVSSAAELTGKTDFDFFPTDLAQQYVDGDQEAMRSKTPIGIVIHIKDSDGNYCWIESYKSALVTDGKVVGSLGYARDITENIQREKEYQSLVESFPNSVTRFNSDCERIFLNSKNAQFFELDTESLLGTTPTDIPGGNSAIVLEEKIREVFQNGLNQNVALEVTMKDGRQKIMDIVLAPEFNAENKVKAVIAVGQDVTESYESQKRINNLAYYDPLTKLPNRILFLEQLEASIKKTSLKSFSFAVLMLDLDGFKEVNDLLGHAVGDMLLRESARRLESCLRSTDTVARLGGDEFAILLSNIHENENAGKIAHKILESLKKPIVIDGSELFITASIGIVICPYHSRQASDLVKFSDIAMYQAKKQRNNFQYYSSEMTQKAVERNDIESSLRRALQNDEFLLHYQPQINLQTGKTIGVEALLRWNRHHREMIAPDRFIGIAEDSGIIIDIGQWVMLTAFSAAVKWNTGLEAPITVAINLSSRQFIHNDLLSTIKLALEQTKCNPRWITLEITESLLLHDSDKIRKILKSLDKMGFRISLDDFGTGYSALSYLNKFPVSEIKIDKSFVQGIVDNPDHGLVIQAIILMAKSLGKDLVAEGVETVEQSEFLLKLGCQTVQGFLYSKPKPFNEIVIL